MLVKHLQDYLEKFTEGPGGKALGPCSKKLIYMYKGAQIMELEACGLKLEPLCLGLEACGLLLDRLGA